MTAERTQLVTPNTSADEATNCPARLPRRQRVAAAIASGVISGVVLGAVLWGITGPVDAPVVIVGEAVTADRT